MDDVTTALFSATTAAQVKKLLAKGADVNARDGAGFTPLLAHARADWESDEILNTLILNALIEAGAKVKARTSKRATALHLVRQVRPAMALLNAGVDVNARRRNGETPLHNTVDLDITKAFIAAGADINACDKRGWTPLRMLIEEITIYGSECFVENCKLLIDAGADPMIEDKKGASAYSLAVEWIEDVPELAELVQKINAKKSREAILADDTLTRIKESKPATPKKRRPL